MAPIAIMNQTHTSSAPNGIHKPSQPWRPTERLDAPKRTTFAFDPIEDALASFAAGEFLVVMDDENRENEGDLIISGSQCTTEKMAWMIKHTRYVLSTTDASSCTLPYSRVLFSRCLSQNIRFADM